MKLMTADTRSQRVKKWAGKMNQRAEWCWSSQFCMSLSVNEAHNGSILLVRWANWRNIAIPAHRGVRSSTPGKGVSQIACYRMFFCPFKIRRMAAIVFQFRVVAGTPYSLSIWPR